LVRRLLDVGVTKKATDMKGGTALDLPAKKGHEAVVRLLLEPGGSIPASDTSQRWSPLGWAAYDCYLDGR
jgi:ankyrin repeat protein